MTGHTSALTLPSLSSASRIICASLKGGMYAPPAGPAGFGTRSAAGTTAAAAGAAAAASASSTRAAGPPIWGGKHSAQLSFAELQPMAQHSVMQVPAQSNAMQDPAHHAVCALWQLRAYIAMSV